MSDMKKDDLVTITHDGKTIDGVILLCSENQRSLCVVFDGAIADNYGAMALAMDSAGVYRSLLGNAAFTVRLRD